MNKLHRQIADLFKEMLANPSALVGGWREELEGYRGQLTGKRRPSPSSRYKGPGKKAGKRAKVAKSREDSAGLRRDAMKRAQDAHPEIGRAYVVGEVSRALLFAESAQLCHLNGGVGQKRQTQTIDNVVIDGDRFNRDSDKRPAYWLPFVKAHCARIGVPLPPRWVAIEAKLEMNAALAAAGGNRNG
jgi:hypothetical protein